MSPLDAASLVLVMLPLLGLAAAGVYALARRGRTSGLTGRTAIARAASYAALAAVLLVAARTGVAGMAVFLGLVGAAALVEWGHLFDLPRHHRVALVIAHGIVIAAVAIAGTAAVPALVGGIVLWGAAWPVIRADTGRAIRDLGYAAVGAVLVTVMLAHGVMLVHQFWRQRLGRHPRTRGGLRRLGHRGLPRWAPVRPAPARSAALATGPRTLPRRRTGRTTAGTSRSR